MAIALTLAPAVQAVVGRPIVVTGTGFTNGGNVELNIYGVGGSISVKPIVVASGGGAITTVGKVSIVPWKSGLLRVQARDITAGTQITKTVRVSAGS